MADHLRAQLAMPPGQGRIGREELRELVDVVDRMRHYAQHLGTCGYFTEARPYGGATLPGGCTCGLKTMVDGPGEATWAGRMKGGG